MTRNITSGLQWLHLPPFSNSTWCLRVLSCSVMSSQLFCDPMDLPGSSVHGIFQARVLDWVAISSSRGSSQRRDWTRVSYIFCTGRCILCHWATGKPLVRIAPKFSVPKKNPFYFKNTLNFSTCSYYYHQTPDLGTFSYNTITCELICIPWRHGKETGSPRGRGERNFSTSPFYRSNSPHPYPFLAGISLFDPSLGPEKC